MFLLEVRGDSSLLRTYIFASSQLKPMESIYTPLVLQAEPWQESLLSRLKPNKGGYTKPG